MRNNLLRSSPTLGSFIHIAMLSFVWFAMTEGISGSWLIGLPVIIIVVIFRENRENDSSWAFSITGSVAFIPFFIWQSLVSGIDVAARALRPDMGLQPVLMDYRFRLPQGSARRLFINCITLMPGTLSVMVKGDAVLVHVLDENQQVLSALQDLEARVGAVFGISFEELVGRS